MLERKSHTLVGKHRLTARLEIHLQRFLCILRLVEFISDKIDIFKKYYYLTDAVIANATKEELAECARLLALNVAHYRQKHGELPLEEQNKLLNTAEVDAETAELLADMVSHRHFHPGE